MLKCLAISAILFKFIFKFLRASNLLIDLKTNTASSYFRNVSSFSNPLTIFLFNQKIMEFINEEKKRRNVLLSIYSHLVFIVGKRVKKR